VSGLRDDRQTVPRPRPVVWLAFGLLAVLITGCVWSGLSIRAVVDAFLEVEADFRREVLENAARAQRSAAG